MLEGFANSMAVLLSVWVGLHYRAPEWLAIYGSAAVVSALLPAHRAIGAIGLAIGLAVAVSSVLLLRDAPLALSDLIDAHGGPAAPMRELCVAGVTALWLLVGSALRLRQA